MKKIFQKKPGSFLADVMISMGILTMSITASLTLLNQSIMTNSVNKNKIIAVNLAREGIEGVRLVRDTNWLRYGTKKRICWNFWSDTDENQEWDTTDATCSEDAGPNSGQNNHPIGIINPHTKDDPQPRTADETAIKSYLLALNTENYDFTLVENFLYINADGDVENQSSTCDNDDLIKNDGCSVGDDNYRHERTRDGNLTSRLYLNPDTQLYTHNIPGTETEKTAQQTDFYREIFIEYPLGDGGFYPDGTSALTNQAKDNQMTVTAQVWYKGHGGMMKKVVLETELTDYLQRENWSD